MGDEVQDSACRLAGLYHDGVSGGDDGGGGGGASGGVQTANGHGIVAVRDEARSGGAGGITGERCVKRDNVQCGELVCLGLGLGAGGNQDVVVM